jgi:hypothetical protein
MPDDQAMLAALRRFADAVTAKMKALTPGEPEDQLRGPFETFMQEAGYILSGQKAHVVCTGETRLAGRLGKPDYAAHAGEQGDGPTLPKADAQGNYPAVAYARVSLARKIIKARRPWQVQAPARQGQHHRPEAPS